MFTFLDDGLVLVLLHVLGLHLPPLAEEAVEAGGQHPLEVQPEDGNKGDKHHDEVDGNHDDDGLVGALGGGGPLLAGLGVLGGHHLVLQEGVMVGGVGGKP